MSRIAGFLSLTLSDFEFDPQLLDNMAGQQQHRGYTQPVFESTGPLAVALMAVPDDDPDAVARHCARDSARRVSLYIDGTLFNRSELERDLRSADALRIDGPTVAELALAAYMHWGEACFSRFSGMFAIVILDRMKGLFFLARDQFGAKTLNYTILGDRLAFASEFKPLLALRRERKVNRRALLEFSLHGDVLPPETLFDGIFTVPHGHYLLITSDSTGPRLTPYHNATDEISAAAYDECLRGGSERFLDLFDSLLNQSVKECMTDSGSVGVALSGGVDSAIITAIAAKYGGVRAVHVSVPEGRNLDERPMAEAVAGHVGAPISVLTMTGDLYRRELANATLASEMPLWHMQNVGFWLACRQSCELGIRTLLCGDTIGQWLSPGSHTTWRRLQPLLKGARALPTPLTAFAQKFGYALGKLPFNSPGFSWYLPMAVQLIDGYAREALQDRSEAAYAFVEDVTHRKILAGKLADVYRWHSGFRYRGDRLGNASGVEYRTPFGDVRALRLAMNTPFGYIIRGGVPKWPVKELATRYLPRSIAYQKKVAWSMPGDIYLRPYATPRFFEDGFCAQAFGLSRPAIGAQVGIWQQQVNSLSRMIHMEVWGRLFVLGETSSQLTEYLASFQLE